MVRDILAFIIGLFAPDPSKGDRTVRVVFAVVCLGILVLAVTPISVTLLTSLESFVNGDKETPMVMPPEAFATHGPNGNWPQAGITGTFDRAALQRGYQVYAQVCAACHSLKLLSYRDLSELGFNQAEVKAIASNFQVADTNDNGEPVQRQALPADFFVSPFPNEKAARAANGGALPPDLSLIIKAREGHEDYVYSILTGFGLPVPPEETIQKGMNYNPWFAGHQIAMPPPLHEGAVSFADGTPATVEQMAKDVVQFLAWSSEPKLEMRHQTGIKVILFLIVFAVLIYRVKRKVWKKLH